MIKAIETHYNGYRFRSRLEARWAKFFDAQRIAYDYEKEWFELPGGRYLPDFWLPVVKMWGEVKPEVFTDGDMLKCVQLHRMTGHPCILLEGTPDFREYKVTKKNGPK